MKAALLLLPLPIAAALAFAPPGTRAQDPDLQATGQAPIETAATIELAEMQYIDLQGNTTVVSARNVVEIRVLEDQPNHIRLELLYENGDYSLLTAQAIHLLRSGASPRTVKIIRTTTAGMRFPRLP